MKKILVLFGLVISVSSYGQLQTVDNGTGPGAGDGEILYTAFEKVNSAIEQVNQNTTDIGNYDQDKIGWTDTIATIATKYDLDTLSKFEVEYIDFDTTTPDPAYRKARLFYDTIVGTFVGMINSPELLLNIGQEMLIYGRNATNTNMIDGEAVYIDSSGLDPYPVFRRAIADDPEIASATIGIVTETIESGTLGYITRFGGVGMDVSRFNENDLLYVSPSDSGQLVDYAPRMPYYRVRIGRVIEVGVDGTLGVDVEPFTGNDTEVSSDGVFNGVVLDKQAIADTQKVAGLYFETYNETQDTIDLPFMYENEIYLLNTTSSTGRNGRAEVQLTYGTATSALTNYIYIDNSGASPVLAAKTTSFGIDDVRVAECGVFDSASHSIHGFAYFQRFNNSIDGGTTDGWVNRSAKRHRLNGSKWESGVDPTVTITADATVVDTVLVSMTSGVIWQFNKQTYNAQDGAKYLWLNSPNGERWIYNLGEIDSTSDGTYLHGGNNRRYRLNLFNIQNSGDFDDFIAVNAPTDYYSTDDGAINDVSNTSVTTVPSKYGKVATRHSALVLNYSTASSGTITNLLGTGGYQDERGQLLGIGGGGGGSGAAVTDFSDAEITIYNSADPTKIMDFDISSVTTGNTRTLTMSDYDIDLNNIQFDLNTNTRLGASTLLSSGNGNTQAGNSAGGSLTTGSQNSFYGTGSGGLTTTASNCIALGYFAGRRNVSLSNRLFINSINRTNILGDTTLSIIYGLQASTTANQQLYLNANVQVSDSLYLNKLEDVEGDEQWLGLTSTTAVFGDSLIDASEGLTDPLINFNEWLQDTVNNEIGWITPNGNIEYSIKGRPSKTIYKLQYMIEMLMRNQVALETKIEELEKELAKQPKNKGFVRTRKRR